MSRIIFTLLVLLATVSLRAQRSDLHITITNAIKTDTLPPAGIQLYSLPDTILAATQIAVINGNSFTVTNFSKYIIRVTAVGFAGIEKTVAITNKDVRVALPLKKKITDLDAITVTARKPLVTQEDDKTIVDAEALANSSSNAYEVLEKTPGAIVDQDGNVYLSSASPATIHINGREIKLSATDLASLLKSLPAGSVSKIEILRNPSAKYDAASSGGIVNIILKKGVKIGSSGSINIGSFQGMHNTRFAGFNLNKAGNKTNSYLSYQLTGRNNFEDLNSERLLPANNTLLIQKAHTTYPVINHYLGAGTDISFNKKLSVSYDLRLSAGSNQSKTNNTIDIIDNFNQSPVGNNTSAISNNGTSVYLSNNISGKYKIDTAGSEWTTTLDHSYFRYDNEQVYTNYFQLPAKPTLSGNGTTNNRKNIFTAQTDLTKKIKYGITIETGFKLISSNSNNSADYFYQRGGSGIQRDSFQTNTFRYTERITSGYLQVSKTILGFTIKPGIRVETTDINGRQLFPADTALSIKRTDLFPYLYLRHKIMRLFGFELNGNIVIRRSITRPYYEVLNPYPKYIDQYLFDVGNPKLQPQFTNNYEFNITADQFTVFSLGINKTKNIFANVTYQDDVTGIAYRTYDNLGTNQEVYLRIVGGIPPGRKYFFYAGAQQNINSYNGFYQNKPLSYKRNSWVFFMYHNLKTSPTFNITVNGFMRLNGLQNFYELNTFGSLSVSFNKSILDKKANLILSCNDVLHSNQVAFSIQQGNVNASGTRVNDTRRIGLTFRYNFGIKPKEEKKSLFEQPADNKDD